MYAACGPTPRWTAGSGSDHHGQVRTDGAKLIPAGYALARTVRSQPAAAENATRPAPASGYGLLGIYVAFIEEIVDFLGHHGGMQVICRLAVF